MPSPLKSAWAIEYIPASPTLFPATEETGGELKLGRCGDAGAAASANDGDLARAASDALARILFLRAPAKLSVANASNKIPTVRAKLQNLRLPAAERKTIMFPPDKSVD